MHLPDGLVNLPISGAAIAASGVICAGALRKAGNTLGEKQAPVIGMTGAFIFAAQMLNFPVGPGVSGHFMGGALAVALLGAPNALLVMSLVLVVQCLLLADGGLTALGVNIFALGVAGVFAAAAVLRLARFFCTGKRSVYLLWTAAAALFSVVASSVVCGGALYYSGTLPAVGWAALIGVHIPIGIGEAFITYGALSVIFGARPDLIANTHMRKSCGVAS